jgi:hypothetical protein
MPSLTTGRLINAPASLEAADRALWNLWVTRGLDDERLAALTRIPVGTLEARRDRIVNQLSDELGLRPEVVRAALDELATSNREAAAAGQNGAAGTAPPAAEPIPPGPAAANGNRIHSSADLAGALLGPTAPEATASPGLLLGPAAPRARAPTAPAASPRPPAGRRRALWIAAGLLVAVLVGVAIAALASSGGGTHHRTVVTASGSASTSASATTAPAVLPTSPTPTPAPPTRTAGGPVTILGSLPGGLMHAHGSVRLTGPTRHLRLKLTVSGLPAPRDGHYEVWLYNSVVNSQPLGRLRAGRHHVSYRLPAHAGRYRWIDISFQPLGAIYHSGESELRATDPAHTTQKRLHRPTARRPHQLRRATSGSKKAKTSK